MVLLKIKNKNIKILNLHKKVGCIESHSADGSPAIALSSEPVTTQYIIYNIHRVHLGK